jgi:hypothetical protein
LRELNVKLNKGGLILVAVYICFFVVLSAIALMARDPKGAWFFGQLSVLPALAFLGWTGLLDLMAPYVRDNSWINSGLFSVPLSLVIVYLVGWAANAFRKLVAVYGKDPSAPIPEEPPDWHKR